MSVCVGIGIGIGVGVPPNSCCSVSCIREYFLHTAAAAAAAPPPLSAWILVILVVVSTATGCGTTCVSFVGADR